MPQIMPPITMSTAARKLKREAFISTPTSHLRRPDQLGAGGGFEELLWEPQSRLDPPICRTSSRRSAPDQLDPALVESGRPGRWSGSSERAGNPARWIDQRAIEQRVPPLRAR